MFSLFIYFTMTIKIFSLVSVDHSQPTSVFQPLLLTSIAFFSYGHMCNLQNVTWATGVCTAVSWNTSRMFPEAHVLKGWSQIMVLFLKVEKILVDVVSLEEVGCWRYLITVLSLLLLCFLLTIGQKCCSAMSTNHYSLPRKDVTRKSWNMKCCLWRKLNKPFMFLSVSLRYLLHEWNI